jgi:translation elongation factor EF-Ts
MAMITKTRRQGNSIMLTVPSDFKLPEGVSVEPELQSDGIFYRFVRKTDIFFDFDSEILSDVLDEGLTDKEQILAAFKKRKQEISSAWQVIAEDARENIRTGKTVLMTREELEEEIGL